MFRHDYPVAFWFSPTHNLEAPKQKSPYRSTISKHFRFLEFSSSSTNSLSPRTVVTRCKLNQSPVFCRPMHVCKCRRAAARAESGVFVWKTGAGEPCRQRWCRDNVHTQSRTAASLRRRACLPSSRAFKTDKGIWPLRWWEISELVTAFWRINTTRVWNNGLSG